MNFKRLSVSREVSVNRLVIDRETQNTRDYKRLNKAMLKGGLMRSDEHVVAIEHKTDGVDGWLDIIVG
jgi:hypothetical protein